MAGQSQKGGDNSTLYQVAGDLVQGITAKDCVEIAEYQARKVIEAHFAKADTVAAGRMQELNDRIIPKLEKLERLEAFADPAYQISLRKAQLGAASTERGNDYDLLAELLEGRAQDGEDRMVRASLERAIELVSQIDDEALSALTALNLVNMFPNAAQLSAGLGDLEQLSVSLLASSLPTGREWLDHLDLLGAVRVHQGFGNRTYEQMLAGNADGYIARGIEQPSDAGLHEFQFSNGVRIEALPHELRPGFWRLAVSSTKSLEKILETHSAESRDLILAEAREVWGLGTAGEELTPQLATWIDEYPTLASFREWWNQIPTNFTTTQVGELIARSNARRLDIDGLLPDWTT